MKDLFNKFIHWGLCGNYWGWSHALAGGVGYLLAHKLFSLNSGISLLAVLLGAIAWEFVEFVHTRGRFDQVYGNGGFERFLYDSAGDIILAMSVAVLISLG